LDEDFGISAALRTGGDISETALRKAFDPGQEQVFERHDPGARPKPEADLLKGYEAGPPLVRWSLTPQDAAVVNASVPAAEGPQAAARPFILRASAADRAAALGCLTEAVYYEAGFEPIEGAQAVAQVVLNRVRHPVFPKTICGVVFQGADLKTGCQFSFACDGSLAKTPAPGAWARAKAVAERALSGYVFKGVGEATHYHTKWIVPWWAPTVSKVAQVGSQIFYRWPGDLGEPDAFTSRYEGHEQAGPLPLAMIQTLASAAPTAPTPEPAAPALTRAPAVQLAPPPEAVTVQEPAAIAVLQVDAPDLKSLRSRGAPPAVNRAGPGAVGCVGGGCQHW